MMAKHWSYLMFLIWISYLIIAGILMFTRGFLLRRDAFTETSSCVPYSSIPCTPAGSTSMNITNGHEYHCTQEDKLSQLLGDINSASKLCLPKKAKVILLVIDALRYDFSTYLPDLENPAPFQNKLPVIRDLLLTPKHARLYKFIADPPTTTMQRLKALTTGGLPTFIDAGSNFASPEIDEDNIIDQLIKQNQNITFMGDDTWNHLYPNRFVRHWPFPSFNVFDLDTVDYGIIDHIYSEIARKDWSLLIAHFLGVDHCGHRYGPNHQEMDRKLSEMNEMIKNVINVMDDETILFVIGDHGMTNTGDHGGETDLEVSATLFIYSQIPLVSFETSSVNSVKQVDLIPTLASILGIPIPYSNLGSLILDAFPTVEPRAKFAHWQQALLALWTNVQQTTNYLRRYSETSNQLNSEKLAVLKENLSKLNAKVNHLKNEDDFKSFAQDVKEYFILARETCAEVWIQFDSFSMSRGLLIVFLTIFFAYMITDGIPGNKLADILGSSFLLCAYTMMAAAVALSTACFYCSLVDNLELTVFFSTAMVSIVMLAIVVTQNWEAIAMHWYEGTKGRRWIDVASRLILLLFISVLFTNSYILEEAGVLAYLSLALVFATIYDAIVRTTNPKASSDRSLFNSIKPKWNSYKTKLLLLGLAVGVLVRASMVFWRCRDEQKWCVNFAPGTDEVKKVGHNAEKIQCVISLVFLALLVTTTRIWLRSCGNLVGFSSTVTLARYAPTVMVVCSAGFWLLHRLPQETKSKLVAGWQVDILAWTVYALVALGAVSVAVQPLCVYVLPKRREQVSVYGQENIIPQLFNQVKGLYEGLRGDDDDDDDTANTPVVYGLGTVYSAAYVVFSVFTCLTIALLLGDGFAPSAVLMYFTAALVLATLSIAHYERASTIEQLLDVPSSSVLCWVLLSHYFFYGTGHQPSFPLIHWEAAFVGTGGAFSHNFIPASLVGVNTFGSYILFAAALPLLIIAPFTLYIMFPNLPSAKFTAKDLRRGELLLYEHDDLLLRSMLSVSCKYILFHGIRMFACMLAVTIHCRHLMVWGIFAPKLIFEGIALMVSFGFVAVAFLLLIRINKNVNTLVVRLEKQNR